MNKIVLNIIAVFLLIFNPRPLLAASSTTCWDGGDNSAMLHMNGTDASTTFTDEDGKTWTARGNAQIDTAQSKFGGASGLFDGAGDYIDTPDSEDFNFGASPFTIDFQVRFNVKGAENGMIAQSNTADAQDTSNAFTFRVDSATTSLFFVNDGGTTRINQTVTDDMTTGVWYHVAIIRGWGGVTDDWAVTVDGTAKATFTTAGLTLANYTNKFYIGFDPRSGNQEHDGWIDEVRITKGVALWTANFTAPSSEYTVCVVQSAGIGISGVFQMFFILPKRLF